jgi:hypothetical protein
VIFYNVSSIKGKWSEQIIREQKSRNERKQNPFKDNINGHKMDSMFQIVFAIKGKWSEQFKERTKQKREKTNTIQRKYQWS